MTAKDLNAIVGCNSGRDVTDARKISGLRDDEDEPSVTAYCLAVCSDKSLYFELGDKDCVGRIQRSLFSNLGVTNSNWAKL